MLVSGVGPGERAGGSGFILERHWLSSSDAVGWRSGAGRSWNSRRGPRCPSSFRPSPQAGDCLRSPRGPSWLRTRPSLAGPGPVDGTGESGPFRSQFPKSRTFPSLSKFRLRSPRSLPASDAASNWRYPPLSEPRLPGRSGSGPFRVQSVSSRASGRSFANYMVQEVLRFSWYAPLTRLSNINSDVSSLELGSTKLKCLFQAVERGKFDIAKPLGLALQLVLDYAYICDGTAIEKPMDITLCCVERKIA